MDELPRTSDVARGIDSVQPEAFGHHGVITAWYRLKLMITWRKIGVVVSVLWLIGLPIFVMFDSNRRASEFYAWCRSAESRYATDMTPEQQLELCTRCEVYDPVALGASLDRGQCRHLRYVDLDAGTGRSLLAHFRYYFRCGA
jgi:hypothetical protein